MTIAMVGGTIIDGTGNTPLREGTVVIDGAQIQEVGPRRELGPDVCVVDVAGKTVMPGLIDCHNHYGPWFQWLISNQKYSLMYLASKTVDALRGTLESGCTTARDMGGLEAGFRDAIAEGLIPGPRIQTALVIIQATNGLTDFFGPLGGTMTPQGLSAFAPGLPSPWCDGPYEARKKVREVLRFGADVVKVANDGYPSSRMRFDRTLFTQEEMDAIVDEAHRAGVPVGVHAHTHDSVMMSLRAGVDSIEEGCFLDDECVGEMVKRGTWYVPCLSNPHWWVENDPTPEFQEPNRQAAEASRQSFILAWKAGVNIAMGTDAGYAVGETALELGWMVEAGMPAMEAIVASTGRAAEFLRIPEVGTLCAGKQADLLVVDGDPLQDIGVLSVPDKLALVMKAGVPYFGSLSSALPRLRNWPHRTLL